MSVAALILGIASLTILSTFGFGFITAVVGLILGIIGRKKSSAVGAPTGMATAGIIISAIAIAYNLLIFIACVACTAAMNTEEFWEAFEDGFYDAFN